MNIILVNDGTNQVNPSKLITSCKVNPAKKLINVKGFASYDLLDVLTSGFDGNIELTFAGTGDKTSVTTKSLVTDFTKEQLTTFDATLEIID